jgi:general secretion pathway protein J
MTASHTQATGFTLIEVLVALALMSLIGTILLASLQIASHTWQRVTREVAAVDEISRAQQFLRQRLATIDPPQSTNAVLQPALVGVGDAMEFTGLANGPSGKESLRYQVSLSRAERGVIEVRYREDREHPFGSPDQGWSSETLLDHASALTVAYWRRIGKSEGEWVDHWSDKDTLPRLIRVEVSFAPNDSRRWPPLYVEPRINASANCLFDPVSRRCRGGA